MPEFFLVAIVLMALAAFFVLAPLMMNRSQLKSDRSDANVTMFQDRLVELELDLQNGVIEQAEFQQLKVELERRLLDDAVSESVGTLQSSKPSLKFGLVLLLGIGLTALGVYHNTGAKADWDISETLKQTRHKAAAGESTEAEAAKLLAQLEQRLKQKPDDPHYLMLMGSTQMELANYPAATDAYQRLSQTLPDDPSVLAQYAQALYLSSDRRLTEKVKSISDKALAINPQQPTVLGMLGIASFEIGDYQGAISYWQRLLPMLGPVSPNRKMITAGIEQAKAMLAQSGIEVEESVTPEAVGGNASLQLNVALDSAIDVDSNAVVFVFARAAAGPKMPLAVARLRVSDLPASVTLDDSMAMAPGLNLSSFENVEVVARISKNGIANPGPGDVEGSLGPLELAVTTDPVSLVINRVLR